jgi:parallel beta-helix repeat protein
MIHFRRPALTLSLTTAVMLLCAPPIFAQEQMSEAKIRQTIGIFEKLPDAQIEASSPLFGAAQNQIKTFLSTLIGQEGIGFVDTFFIKDIKSISKQGNKIEVAYPNSLTYSADKLPPSWKTQIEKALADGGGQGDFGAMVRQNTLRLVVNTKEAEISTEGVSIEINNAFLFFGATLESPSAKLVRRDGVLGLEIGLLPRVAGGVFSGDRKVSFIPLSKLGAVVTVATLNYATNGGQPFAAAPTVQAPPATSAELFVDATTGSDSNAGTAQAPLKTITKAIELSTEGTKITAASGTYSSSETFPLKLKRNTSLVGVGSVQIQGGGKFLSSTFGGQNVVLVAPKEGLVENVTVSNTTDLKRGYGMWMESSNAIIRNCRALNNALTGLVITGASKGQVLNSTFQGNRADGIDSLSTSEPLLQGNIISENGTGVSVGDKARPFLEGNQINQNRYGVTIESASFPRLRSNTIQKNKAYGVVAINGGQADIGTPQENTVTTNGIDLKFLERKQEN